MNEKTSNTPHLQGGNGLLPYPVIVSAVSGNVDAMNTVLKHYEGYITTLSTRTMYDEAGCPPPVVRYGAAAQTGNQADYKGYDL